MSISPQKLPRLERRDWFNLAVAATLIAIIAVLLLRPSSGNVNANSAPADNQSVAVASATDTASALTNSTPTPTPTASPSPTITPTPTATPLPPMSAERPRLAKDGRLTLLGTGVPGAKLEIWDKTSRIDSAIVAGDGSWSWQGVLDPGEHFVQVRMLDVNGLMLNESDVFELAVEQPALPFGLPLLNDSIFIPDTGDLVLTGVGQPDATLAIVQDGSIVGSAQVAEDGTWQFGITLPAGDYEFAIWTLNEEGEPVIKSPPVPVTVIARTTPTPSPTSEPQATPETTPDPGPGIAYIVQPGDSLSKIAIAKYNNFNLYKQIWEATNAKAAVDPTFSPIVDPAKLRTGQKLWLPDVP
ncbi:MAG: LysM peptidoglycan-binding domain-containing protein [Caldilineales bacterium]|nr:LysM peptidoglycan-binding domain-containing protein [Caldilineales bacterium]